MELPHGGEGWQQLRQGYLPPEFTAGEWGLRQLLSASMVRVASSRGTTELRAQPINTLLLTCMTASWAGLSSELRSVLTMMLEPDPQLRATAKALLALPMLRQPRPWNVLWYMAAEALSRGWALWQVSLCGGGGGLLQLFLAQGTYLV